MKKLYKPIVSALFFIVFACLGVQAQSKQILPWTYTVDPNKNIGFDSYKYEPLLYRRVIPNGPTQDLPFRMLKPNNFQQNGTPYPLIIMLHGRGERGTDNNFQLLWGGLYHQQRVEDGTFNGLVVFPQEPFGNWGNHVNGEPSTALSQVWDLVELLISNYNVDQDRVYIHGLSSGGSGVWASLISRPDLFAAALPMSAPGEPNFARRTSQTPLWLFQGGLDVNPSPPVSQTMVAALRAEGAINETVTKYSEYPDLDHFTWNRAYQEPDFFPFMLRHNKRQVRILGTNPLTPGSALDLAMVENLGGYQWYKDGAIIPNATQSRLVNITEAGTYFAMFKRKAADANWVQSDPVVITGPTAGTPNVAPTTSVTSPSNNAVYTAPANITINATASDVDGSVKKVEFYNGTTLLFTDYTSPYSYSWNNVPVGTYSITSRASDNKGTPTFSAPISVTVNSDPNQAPTVSITSPTNNTNFGAPAVINITANASDADGSISKVEFYNGGTLIGTDATAPYQFSWTFVQQGTYSLFAKAYDDKGSSTLSSFVVAKVNPNQLPAVSITSPSNNSIFVAPASITINANASDVDGTVSKVDFYNGAALIGTDNTAPFQYTWNNVGVGSYSITAKATDNSNGSATSSAVSVSVVNDINASPSVSITAPTNNSTFTAPATINFTADASDPDGTVSKVEFFNGATLIGSALTAPYSISWTNVSASTYSITAKATDNKGAITTSAAVSVTVNVAGNTSPTVNITEPLENATITTSNFTIKANATDPGGSVSKVEFYDGAILLGTDTYPPFQYTWYNPSAGSHSIIAKAIDNQGASSTQTILINIGNDVTNYFTTSANCFTASQAVSFELAAAQTTNATNYTWWYSGTGVGIVPQAGQAYKATVTPNNPFTNGSVCIGVTYSTAPTYKQYCKTIAACVQPRLEEAFSYVSTDGIGKNYLNAGKDIESARVVKVDGTLIHTLLNVSMGQSVEFGKEIPAGLHLIQINYTDGSYDVQKLMKME